MWWIDCCTALAFPLAFGSSGTKRKEMADLFEFEVFSADRYQYLGFTADAFPVVCNFQALMAVLHPRVSTPDRFQSDGIGPPSGISVGDGWTISCFANH